MSLKKLLRAFLVFLSSINYLTAKTNPKIIDFLKKNEKLDLKDLEKLNLNQNIINSLIEEEIYENIEVTIHEEENFVDFSYYNQFVIMVPFDKLEGHPANGG